MEIAESLKESFIAYYLTGLLYFIMAFLAIFLVVIFSEIVFDFNVSFLSYLIVIIFLPILTIIIEIILVYKNKLTKSHLKGSLMALLFYFLICLVIVWEVFTGQFGGLI